MDDGYHCTMSPRCGLLEDSEAFIGGDCVHCQCCPLAKHGPAIGAAISDFLTAVEATPAAPKLSPDRRRTLRQAAMLARGVHPLAALGGHLALHTEAAPADDRTAPGRRCGNCWYRRVLDYHARSYAKCAFGATNPTDTNPRPGPPPRASHSAASDVRGWWPGCVDHTYGDPSTSDDAARWVPEAADA